jgi:2-polyprenyl-3-methyl-5-hydroxy-6-metoxy-1,4-benzoquinol methylase
MENYVNLVEPMTAFAKALLAYHNGDNTAVFTIIRDDGFSQSVPVSIFFDDQNFTELEEIALSLCKGSVLDVGAGAGRHSLELQRRGLNVTATDIEPLCEQIMTQRGVHSVIISDILNWTGVRFDTVLMLMNGIGMVGCPESLNNFLGNLTNLLNAGGYLLCDSIDVDQTDDPHSCCVPNSQHSSSPLSRSTAFSISYAGYMGKAFKWLHISPKLLQEHCRLAGLTFSVIHEEKDGHFLCRIGF